MPDRTRSRRNQIGQVMGPKGHDTRERLVSAAAALVSARPLRELRASDIAREAGLGPSHFYVYFPDVGAAVLAALERQPQGSPALLDSFHRDWSAPDAVDHARGFVTAYLDVWKDNYALLRARNLAADEGDARFMEQRAADIGPILVGLTLKFAEARQAGRTPQALDPAAAAGVILAALERLAAAPRWPGEASVEEARLRQAVTLVLTAALGLT